MLAIQVSCKNDKKEQIDEKAGAPQEVKSADKTAEVNTELSNLSSIPPEVYVELMTKCDYIDYIFYDLPISISQNNPEAIQTNINFMFKEAPTHVNADCKPMGRKFFHHDGEIFLEADMYFNPDNQCFFYIFLENGKPKYANLISKDGINFYMNVFQQSGTKL